MRLTYYQMLGVEPGCDHATIEKAYRRSARRWHPDVNPSPEALERFFELQRAYQALSNPKAREGYNLFLSMNGAAIETLEPPADDVRPPVRRPLPMMISRRRPRGKRKKRGPLVKTMVLTLLVGAVGLIAAGAAFYIISAR